MDKFRIDRANQPPAIMDLLVQLLANQHMFIETSLVEWAKRDNQDLADLTKRFEAGCEVYRKQFWDHILENFGRLDVDDLTE